MNKMMDGVRTINMFELHKIAEFLHVSMGCLMKTPEKSIDTNVIQSFMACVKTEEAKKEIQLVD